MIYLVIGLVTGLVMGLTGAGGALVALPLFLQFLPLSLKDASVLSLVAVVIAAGMNFFFQRKNANLKMAFMLFLPSIVGSYLAAQVKDSLPLTVMKVLLISLSLISLYGVWRPFTSLDGKRSVSSYLTLIVGFLLGVVTTLTGLGGGVLLLPLLLNLYRLPMIEAVPTGLIVISLSSFVSLLIQASEFEHRFDWNALAGLPVGIMCSGIAYHFIVKLTRPTHVERLRQIVFSVVVGVALIKIFYGN